MLHAEGRGALCVCGFTAELTTVLCSDTEDAECELHTGIIRPSANHNALGSQDSHDGTEKISWLQGLQVKARLQATLPSHSLMGQAGSHSQLVAL